MLFTLVTALRYTKLRALTTVFQSVRWSVNWSICLSVRSTFSHSLSVSSVLVCNKFRVLPHYLLTPSSVKLTMSITPPAGCESNPRRPFPIPLKNPSTPSERAPNKQQQKRFLKGKLCITFLKG